MQGPARQKVRAQRIYVNGDDVQLSHAPLVQGITEILGHVGAGVSLGVPGGREKNLKMKYGLSCVYA